MLGTLIQGRISRRRRLDQRHQVGADDRDPPRRCGGASSARPTPTSRCRCSTTASISAACCRRWPAPTRCTSPSAASSTSSTGSSAPTTAAPSRARRSSRRAASSRRRAAGLKALATWHATETIQGCREACGGAGYLSDNRLGELKADTDVFTTFEGDNTILLQLVAKSLLTGFRDEFEEMNAFATAGFVASRPGRRWSSAPRGRELIQRLTDDLIPGRERDEDLLDREYHLGLFRWREEHIAERRGAAAAPRDRGRRRPVRGLQRLPGPRARGRPRPHRARDPRGLRRRGERCADPDLKRVLERAVRPSRARRDRARPRPGSRSTGGSPRPARRRSRGRVNGLCEGLRPHARELVDAFGIPDEVLAAPIGLPGGEASRTAAAEIGDELPGRPFGAARAG